MNKEMKMKKVILKGKRDKGNERKNFRLISRWKRKEEKRKIHKNVVEDLIKETQVNND